MCAVFRLNGKIAEELNSKGKFACGKTGKTIFSCALNMKLDRSGKKVSYYLLNLFVFHSNAHNHV